MTRVTVSPKYQIVIPKEIRQRLPLRKGQKMTVTIKGGLIILLPEAPIKQYRGFLKGMNTEKIREKKDRI